MNAIVSVGRWSFVRLGLDRGWVTLLLIALVTGSTAASITDAEWVNNPNPILTLMAMGLLTGCLLGLSRWKGWQVAVYSLALSLIGVILVVGRLIPGPQDWLSTPFFANVNQMHLQLTVLFLRVQSWALILQKAGTVQDTGLFVVLAGWIGWGACAWLAWWVVRRKQALVGLLPLSLLMAVNVQLSHQGRITLAWYFFFAMLLVLRTGFTRQKDDWVKRRVDHPDELGYEWGMSGMILALLVVSAAMIVSIFGTREGLKALSDMVRQSQAQMNNTAEQLFGGVHAPPIRPGDDVGEPLPSINTPNMSDIGSPIPHGSQTVLHVWIDDPPPVPVDISGHGGPNMPLRLHYWRSQVMGVYTGRGWNETALINVPVKTADLESAPAGHYLLKQRFEIVAKHSGALFGVNEAAQVNNGVAMKATQADGSVVLAGQVDQYDVTSLATNVTVAQLELAKTTYPQELAREYLQLPGEVPARVGQLAREVAGDGTPYQKARRIQDYLRTNFKYDLEVKPAQAGRDVVDAFLFETQAGFCSHFATAMAVMLRTQEVPARVVSGYAMGSYDAKKGMYSVPESASHAWVEVFFPGYGWVEFEPTPGFSSFDYPQGNSAGDNPALLQNPAYLGKPARVSPFVWLVLPVLLAGTLWGYIVWSRARNRRVKDLNRLAGMVYTRVRRGLVWGGAPEAVSLTPDEFAEEMMPALLEYPRLGDALARVTRLYVQSAFSPRVPSSYEIAICEQLWDGARMEWLQMLLRRWLAR